jgi:hypothetical protein
MDMDLNRNAQAVAPEAKIGQGGHKRKLSTSAEGEPKGNYYLISLSPASLLFPSKVVGLCHLCRNVDFQVLQSARQWHTDPLS